MKDWREKPIAFASDPLELINQWMYMQLRSAESRWTMHSVATSKRAGICMASYT